MKKLYENIEDINIRGGVSQLSEVVTAMDIALQNIAENTHQLVGQLIRYSASNKGTQYEKVVNTSLALREELYDASMELNEMQNQIVAYQNKIYRYEEMTESAQRPNPYLVSKNQHVNVETSVIQFNRNDMMNVATLLKNYSERVFHHIKTINEKKNSIANVWRDSQYDIFAEFIDVVTRNVIQALREFEEYYLYLQEKIKELS